MQDPEDERCRADAAQSLTQSRATVRRLSLSLWERAGVRVNLPSCLVPARALFCAILLPTLLLLSIPNPAVAADKNGVSPTTISLPKGPGSIEGLGESFQPSLNTGTAKHSIPLEVPPGTAGHAPRLRLAYEGGGPNGVLGFGWSLPVSSIHRRTDRGIPTYGENVGFERSDVFMSESKEELVPTATGFYFCKNEGAFVRYRKRNESWEAASPNGSRADFGLTAQARIEDVDSGNVFAWLAERETDVHGNTLTYHYTSFPGEQNARQKYLKSIVYGADAPPWTHFHFVVFEYEDRPDWFEDCRPGFVVRTGKRVRRIVIGTQGLTLAGHQQGDFNGDGITDNLNRVYELGYAGQNDGDPPGSLLTSVKVLGASGTNSLPPATLGYARCNPPDTLSATGKILGGSNEPTMVMDNELADLLDLNGDGLPDLLQTGGPTHRAWLNLGEGLDQGERVIRWAPPVEVASTSGDAWNFSLDAAATHLADMNGDGIADLVHQSAADAVFYFPNLGRVGWEERRPMSVETSIPPAPFGTADVRTADVDFDKRMDLIRGDGTLYQIWFNIGENRYSERVTALPDHAFDFSLPGVHLVDVNGDRVPDIARVRPASIQVTAGLGYGRFAPLVTITIPNGPLDDTLAAKAKLADLNGDGLADLVIERAAPGALWYWLNLGNYSLSPLKTIAGMPIGIGQNASVRWADLNGNGTTDLLYADQESTPRIQTVDLGEIMGCALPPNTLVTISNGIGEITRITYQPSTKFALEDAAAGRPWADPMPFPVTVVSEVRVLDSLGHEYLARYRYHDGYYDGGEKQFRGFAEAEKIEVGDASAPTLVTRSRFDTGRIHESLKGKLLSVTATEEDGDVFWQDLTTWTDPPRVLMTGTNGTNVTFVHPVTSLKFVRELGQGTERRTESESSYDSYGNQTNHVDYGIVEEGNRSAFNDERVTQTTYALNLENWRLRLPHKTLTLDENGVVRSRVEFFYDDPTFSGENPGEVTQGNMTLKREWVDPTEPAAYINVTRTHYDAFGNAIRLLDPLAPAPGGNPDPNSGHYRDIEYDPHFHTFPVRETIHVGGGKAPLSVIAENDYGLAFIYRYTDANGYETVFNHDEFGRLVSTFQPGDSPEYPSLEYEYALAVPLNATNTVSFIETRTLDCPPGTRPSRRDHYFISRKFVDGLGRELMTKTEAEPAPDRTTPRILISGAVLFNARQKPRLAVNPCFSTLPDDTLDALLAFENIESPGWQGQFVDEATPVTLGLETAPASVSEYDALLRETRTLHPDGTSCRTAYEPLITRSFDENDSNPTSPDYATPKSLHYDGLSRLIRVDETARLTDEGQATETVQLWTTRYEYDLHGQLTTITDAQGNRRTMTCDGLNRRTQLQDPDRGVTRWLYDEGSNVRETIDAKGQRIVYTYDGANRPLTEDYLDEQSGGFTYGRSPDVEYHYDDPYPDLDRGDHRVITAQNLKGMLAWVEDPSGQEHTSYDPRGRVEWTVKRIPDPAFLSHFPPPPTNQQSASYFIAFDYDTADRLAAIRYPDGDSVRYKYNDRNLVVRIPGGPNGHIISNIVYQPSGQPQMVDYGSGARSTYTYDSRLRLTSLLTLGPPDPASQIPPELIHFRYSLDPASNVETVEDRRPASTVPDGEARRNTQRMEYDDLYRLTRVRYSFAPPPAAGEDPGATHGEVAYRYDRIGNMLSQTSTWDHVAGGLPMTHLGDLESGGTLGRWNRVGRSPGDPPGPHALSAIRHPPATTRTFEYDANGNILVMDGLTNTWDCKDRLVAVENAVLRAEYVYDAADRRVLKRVVPKGDLAAAGNGGTNRVTSVIYVSPYYEVRELNTPVKYVWNGSARVARLTGSIDTNSCIQRLSLHAGWNLCALAINGSLPFGPSPPQQSSIEAAFEWKPNQPEWRPVATNETLAAGTVLWLKVAANTVVPILGTYPASSTSADVLDWAFVSSAGLDALSLPAAIPGEDEDRLAWRYDGETQAWRASLLLAMAGSPQPTEFIAPGEVVFIRTATPLQIEPADPALRVRYYHQDHLGSSSCVTDAKGRLVEEAAYYPFGGLRLRQTTAPTPEPYLFSQKEQDRESGLHYFETRYLSSGLARFIQCDPSLPALSNERLSDPQRWNPYAYAGNNPMARIDPHGLDWIDNTKAMFSGAAGVVEDAVAQAAESLSTPQGAVEAVASYASAPVTGGFELVKGVLGLAYSGTQDFIQAASGDEIDTGGNITGSLGTEQRFERMGAGLLKTALVAAQIGGARGLQGGPKPAVGVPVKQKTVFQAPVFRSPRAVVRQHTGATGAAKTQAGEFVLGKTQPAMGYLKTDARMPTGGRAPTLAQGNAARAAQNGQWASFIEQRIKETAGDRAKMMERTGDASSIVREIFREAEEKFGNPILPGDF